MRRLLIAAILALTAWAGSATAAQACWFPPVVTVCPRPSVHARALCVHRPFGHRHHRTIGVFCPRYATLDGPNRCV